MIVIKFGGSSISSSKNIEKSLRIINNYKGNVIVFFSAFGGITNLLLECGKLASLQNKEYLNKLEEIKEKHLLICKSLFDINNQSPILSFVQQNLNHLESILEGVYNLKEFSNKSSATIAGFGELMSHHIIGKLGESRGLDFLVKDSREIITTKLVKVNNNQVDFDLTKKKMGSIL